MKIKAVAKEMKDADVRFISLVARGANRIPFRIVKSEKESGMIDLSKPLKILKGEKPQAAAPEVVGVVVFDQGDEAVMAGVRKSLTDHGFAVDKATKNEDGTVLFSAGEVDANDATIVRLSEDMAVVVKGFSSYSQSLSESTNFSDVMAAQGYYQGVRTACDALVYTMQNVLQKAESSADASAKVSTILSSFGTYVGALTKGLPVAAFKADMSVSEVVKTAKVAKEKAAASNDDKAPEGADEKEWAKMTPEQKAEWKAKAKAKKDEDDAAAAAAASKSEGEGKGGEKPAGEGEQAPAAGDSAPAAKSEQSDGGIAQVLAQLAELNAAVKGVVGDVGKIAEKQEKLEGQFAETARKADNATQAVKTTVVAGAGAGDEPAKGAQVQKSENTDPRTGCFDTAFLPKRR